MEILGYLPDHLIVSGYRVTPVVSFVRPGFQLSLDTTEVTEAFEVPLRFIMDPAHHQARRRKLHIVPGASHLFEEHGALEQVASLASDWFAGNLSDVRGSAAV